MIKFFHLFTLWKQKEAIFASKQWCDHEADSHPIISLHISAPLCSCLGELSVSIPQAQHSLWHLPHLPSLGRSALLYSHHAHTEELSDLVGSPLTSSFLCCGDQGYFQYGTCSGYGGKNYSNVPVCQGPGLAGRREKKRPECGEGCRLRTKEGVTVEELGVMMGREDSNFCLAYLCDADSYDWVLSLDICECEEVNEDEEPACTGSGMCVRYCNL